MSALDRLFTALMWMAAILVALFLLAPIVTTVAISFGSSPIFTLPSPAFTTRWYAGALGSSAFWSALALSLQVAAVSTLLALLLGTAAAWALVRGAVPGARQLVAFFLSPLMLPGIVIGIALLQFFRSSVSSPLLVLVVAHVVIILPYVLRVVLAALHAFDFALIEAAVVLGMPPLRATFAVLVPALAPAFFAGGLFAFLTSMDNYSVSIFLSDARNKTLPILMLQLLEERPDPGIAAISTCLVVLSLVVMAIGGRLVGLRRIVAA